MNEKKQQKVQTFVCPPIHVKRKLAIEFGRLLDIFQKTKKKITIKHQLIRCHITPLGFSHFLSIDRDLGCFFSLSRLLHKLIDLIEVKSGYTFFICSFYIVFVFSFHTFVLYIVWCKKKKFVLCT